MHRLHCFTKLLFSFALFYGLAVAQTDRATIEGLVKDPSGATIPDANVAIVKVDTNERTELRTNDAGRYFGPNLPIGMYRVTVEKAGFQTTVQENVQLQGKPVCVWILR